MRNLSKLNKGSPEVGQPNQGENYIVLGERIDQELREKIREAIMSTRLASGGTGNPFVTRSVFKAESNCNKVLGRLNAPFHKRYRRDILLSLIRILFRCSWILCKYTTSLAQYFNCAEVNSPPKSELWNCLLMSTFTNSFISVFRE